MMALLMLISLAGLLLGSDAINNNVLNTRPQGAPFFVVLPSTNFHERVIAAQQRTISRQQTVGQGIPPPRHIGQPPSSVSQPHPTRFPSRVTTTTQSNSHNNNQQSHIFSTLGPNQRPAVIIQDTPFSSFNPPPSTSITSQSHRTTTFLNQAPHTITTQTPRTSRPSGSPGGQNPATFIPHTKPSIFDQNHKPQSFDQVPITSQPTHKHSVVQDHKDSVTPQAPKPSSIDQGRRPSSVEDDDIRSGFGQDSKPSLSDPQAPLRNPVCYNKPDHGTCRAALPRYYFDPETGTCNCFLYGGCREHGEGESPGSFTTLGECQRECRPPKDEEGPICKEIFKEEHFVSFLHTETPPPPHGKWVDLSHLSNKELLESFSR